MQESENKILVHLWVPNLFEFKGGIQVYLQDVLQALIYKFPNLSILIFDKLDQGQPPDSFDSPNISFRFSGNLPKFLQTYHFALNLMIKAVIKHPKLILCGCVECSKCLEN
jgi:hypothetical protein